MTPNLNDNHFMELAIQEALKAQGRTSPNPCVGAVIVKDGEILSTGYHEKAGTPHAEIHALNEAGDKARGATIYVTLEPCSHTGKTPPCSHAIQKSGIARVVIGMIDPNPLVDGGGKQYLEDNGIEIITGVLEEKCRSINRPFIKYITTGLPLVTMKAGISLDGKLNYQSGKAGWITGSETSVRVHQLRNIYDAILVGRKTVEIDDPSLTTRLPNGKGHDATRFVLDSNLSVSPECRVFQQSSPASTWIFCTQDHDKLKRKELEKTGSRVVVLPSDSMGKPSLKALLRYAADNNILSILIEGGAAIHRSFLESQLYDKAYLFYGPLFAGGHGSSLTESLSVQGKESAPGLTNVKYSQNGNDLQVEGDLIYHQIS